MAASPTPSPLAQLAAVAVAAADAAVTAVTSGGASSGSGDVPAGASPTAAIVAAGVELVNATVQAAARAGARAGNDLSSLTLPGVLASLVPALVMLAAAVAFAVATTSRPRDSLRKNAAELWSIVASAADTRRERDALVAELLAARAAAAAPAPATAATAPATAATATAATTATASEPTAPLPLTGAAWWLRWLVRVAGRSSCLVACVLCSPVLDHALRFVLQAAKTMATVRRSRGIGMFIDGAVAGSLNTTTATLAAVQIGAFHVAELLFDVAELVVMRSMPEDSFAQRLKAAYLRSVLKQDLPWLTVNSNDSTLAQLADRGATIAADAAAKPLKLLHHGVQLVVYGWAMLAVDPTFSVVGVLVRVVVLRALNRATRSLHATIEQQSRGATAKAGDAVSKIMQYTRLVQLFACEDAMVKAFSTNVADASRASLNTRTWRVLLSHLDAFARAAVSTATNLFGGFRVLHGHMTMGDYSHIVALESRVAGAIDAIQSTVVDFMRAATDSEAFFFVLRRAPHSMANPQAPPTLDDMATLLHVLKDNAAAGDADDAARDADASLDIVTAARASMADVAAAAAAAAQRLLAVCSVDKFAGAAAAAASSGGGASVGASERSRSSSSSGTPGGATAPAPTAGDIVFDDVCFTYPTPPPKLPSSENASVVHYEVAYLRQLVSRHKVKAAEAQAKASKPVLRGLSFTIPAGTSAAFVGPSGVGKTTIFQLLLRFYEPTTGAIRIAGTPLTAINPPDLRRLIGCVEQTPHILDGKTVKQNLTFGFDPDAPDFPSDARIEEACRRANLLDVIADLPAGFDEKLGWSGRQLSGGQLQRLSIARVLLRDPQILLLDEVTSAQDTATELEIRAGLEAAMKGRTVIMVAHRLKSIEACDQIFVFDAGTVIEHGSHAELYAAGGKYRWMVDAQMLSLPKAAAPHAASAAAAGDDDDDDDPLAALPLARTTSVESVPEPAPPQRALRRAVSVLDDHGSVSSDDDDGGDGGDRGGSGHPPSGSDATTATSCTTWPPSRRVHTAAALACDWVVDSLCGPCAARVAAAADALPHAAHRRRAATPASTGGGVALPPAAASLRRAASAT